MKLQFIANLETGEAVDDVFFVLQTHRDNSGAPALSLSDRSGIVRGVPEGLAAGITPGIAAGDFIHGSGIVEGRRGSPVIVLTEVSPVAAASLDPGDFLPGSFRDTDELRGFLEFIASEVYDSDLSRLLALFLNDDDFMARFLLAPGEIRSHHAYLGGLLEHTVSVATLCQHTVVQHPRLNGDLLITASLLHDIGKIEEFSWRGRIEFTGEGMLWGHVLIGQRMIEERIGNLDGFPREKELRLLHAVVSHHGELEWGSPRPPQSAEALALHHLDNLDAKLKGYFEVIGGGRDISWPELQNLFRRPLHEPLAADREYRK